MHDPDPPAPVPTPVRPADAEPAPSAPSRDVLVLVPVLMAALVFWPAESQFFHGDDFYHLYRASDQPWLAFLLQPHAGHACVAFNAVLGACWALFGMHPRGWFALLVATHLLNTFLCFRLIQRAGGGRYAALVGSLVWALIPGHAQSLTWFSLYGQVLATTCILAVLGSVLATRGQPPTLRRSLAWIVGLLVAVTAHGAGSAAALAVPLAAALVVPAGPGRWRTLAVLAVAWPTMLGIAIAGRTLVPQVAGILPALPPVIRLDQPLPIARLLGELVQFGVAIPVLGIFDPAPSADTARVVDIGWLLLFGAACAFATPPERRTIGAMLIMVAVVYLVTAIGRGSSYAFMLRHIPEPAAIARYHYIPSALLLVASSVAARVLWRTVELPATLVPTAALLIAAVLGIAWLHTDWRPDSRQQNFHGFERARKEMQAAVTAAAGPADVARVPNEVVPIVSGMIGHDRLPGWAAIFVLTEPSDTIAGRRVEFVEPSAKARRFTAAWPRMHGLLVAP